MNYSICTESPLIEVKDGVLGHQVDVNKLEMVAVDSAGRCKYGENGDDASMTTLSVAVASAFPVVSSEICEALKRAGKCPRILFHR